MKKKILAIVLIAGLVLMYGCGSSKTDKKSTSSKAKTQTEESQNSSSSSSSSDNSSTAESGENDPGDAGNNDPTAETAKNNTEQQMEDKYVGSWEQEGLLMSDGSIDDSDGSTGSLTVNSDGTYSMTIKDADGNTTDTSGKWTINSDKKLVVGDYKMGIDDNGYLLRDSGQRDGKGFHLYYAMKKK